MTRRSSATKFLDILTFPIRALLLFHEDRWGLSSLASERFDYVAREVTGRCLDIGCGPHNRFINKYLDGNGVGVDVFLYEGLTAENLLKEPEYFPFEDESFDTVTFIANLNHIPRRLRDIELSEAYRCLKPGGNIVATMVNPIAAYMTHKEVMLFDRLFGTKNDLDSMRGMDEEESYSISRREITTRLQKTGFEKIRKKSFATQWFLNHLYVGWKPRQEPS